MGYTNHLLTGMILQVGSLISDSHDQSALKTQGLRISSDCGLRGTEKKGEPVGRTGTKAAL